MSPAASELSGAQTIEELGIGTTTADNGACAVTGVVFGNVTFRDGSNVSDKSPKDAIFLTDPSIDRDELKRWKGDRTDGTLLWTLGHGSLNDWRRRGSGLLWIRGGPGKGKTMICIFLSQELAEDACTTVLYYFCNEARSSAKSVLRGLLWQMLDKHPDLESHIKERFRPDTRGQRILASEETLWKIICELSGLVEDRKYRLLVDGLDECDQESKRWLASKFARLDLEPACRNLSILVFSRDIIGLSGSDCISLDPGHLGATNADALHVNADVKKFIQKRAEQLSQQLGFNKDFEEYIVRILLEKSEGTFLWVGFVMDELMDLETSSEVNFRVVMDRMPSGLPALYARMLRRIKQENKERSIRLLTWLAMSFKPLSLDVLADILGCEASEGISEREATLNAIKACSPIITMQHVPGEDPKVDFVHQSAREFLLQSPQDQNSIPAAFRIDVEASHLSLTKSCIHALSNDTRLQYYALMNWPKHAKRLTNLSAQLIGEEDAFFGENSTPRASWWHKYRLNFMRLPETSPEDAPPRLHIACFLGLEAWVLSIINEVWKQEGEASERIVAEYLSAECPGGWYPWQYAAEGGCTQTAERLLQISLNYLGEDLTDEQSECMIFHAALAGHEGLVRFLLNRLPDCPKILHQAVKRGNMKALRLLANDCCDEQLKHDGTTALHVAVSSRNVEALRYLLNRGANINITNDAGKTALHLAVSTGDMAIVRVLISGGACCDLTHIKEAATYPHVMRELLYRGTEPTSILLNATLRELSCFLLWLGKREPELLDKLIVAKWSPPAEILEDLGYALNAVASSKTLKRRAFWRSCRREDLFKILYELLAAGPARVTKKKSVSSFEHEQAPWAAKPTYPTTPVEPAYVYALFAFSTDGEKLAGYHWLWYNKGDVFRLVRQQGNLWLAVNDRDTKNRLGWIWQEHFTDYPPDPRKTGIPRHTCMLPDLALAMYSCKLRWTSGAKHPKADLSSWVHLFPSQRPKTCPPRVTAAKRVRK